MKNNNSSGKKPFIVWLSVSSFLIVLLLVVTILTSTIFYDILCTVIGGERARYAAGVEPIYTTEYNSKAEVLEAANKFNEQVCEEGFVLLKNKDNALPVKTPVSDPSVSAKPTVSVFGKNSVNLAYSGSGSGGGDSASAKDIYASLEEAGYQTNPVLREFYQSSRSGPAREANSSDLDSGKAVSIATAETPQSLYTQDVKNSYSQYSDMALIVFTRIGGEGFDLPLVMRGAEGARNDDDHYLQLDQNETDLIQAVCGAGFDKVVVIINSASVLELGFLEDENHYAYNENIDAAILMGFPGNSGAMALGRLLNGSVNPSGRTVDTQVANHKESPTWANFGNNRVVGDSDTAHGDEYVDENGNKTNYYFADYEEGIYVGYKYYETRAVTEGEEWYDDAVVYPFGYGLSYTTFSWDVDGSSLEGQDITQNGKYEITVTVTNTGDVAGKDVVELYGHAPYTDGEVEKSEVILLDFAKTELIPAGGSSEVTLTFDPYYLASYDYKDMNDNGYSTFELDEGDDYCLYISSDSHDRSNRIDFSVSDDIIYNLDPVTEEPVVNRYTDCENEYFNSDYGLESVLSRSDWEGTWPQTDTEKVASAGLLRVLADKETNNPYAEEYEDMDPPWFGWPYIEITLRDMLSDDDGNLVGSVSYDDMRWDLLLDQCNVQDLINMYNIAAFKTQALENIGKPLTNDTDGPAGFVNFMDEAGTYWGTCNYCCETVMGATWNEELIEELGEMVGSEGIIGAAGRGNGMPYSGWYAPGANIHRSAFGGRNFEYFSEDGILSGKMAAAEIKGCQSKGVYCYMKHFALNEQETHRSLTGSSSWVTEQAMREIYLRPFEIAVKDGGTRAMMSSFNRIGARWTGGDYRLITEILRNEWGFRGTVICDFNTTSYMDSRQMAYAGGDLNLVAYNPQQWCDPSSTADLIVLRQCAKNVLYTVVNSNAMNGDIIGYGLPIWLIILIVADCVVAAGIAVWGFFVVRNFVRKRRQD